MMTRMFLVLASLAFSQMSLADSFLLQVPTTGFLDQRGMPASGYHNTANIKLDEQIGWNSGHYTFTYIEQGSPWYCSARLTFTDGFVDGQLWGCHFLNGPVNPTNCSFRMRANGRRATGRWTCNNYFPGDDRFEVRMDF